MKIFKAAMIAACLFSYVESANAVAVQNIPQKIDEYKYAPESFLTDMTSFAEGVSKGAYTSVASLMINTTLARIATTNGWFKAAPGISKIKIDKINKIVKNRLGDINFKGLATDVAIDIVINIAAESIGKELHDSFGIDYYAATGYSWFAMKEGVAVYKAYKVSGGNPVMGKIAFSYEQAALLGEVVQKDIEEYGKAKDAINDMAASQARGELLSFEQYEGKDLIQQYQRETDANKKRSLLSLIKSKASLSMRNTVPSAGDILSPDRSEISYDVFQNWSSDLEGKLLQSKFEIQANINALIYSGSYEKAKDLAYKNFGVDTYAVNKIRDKQLRDYAEKERAEKEKIKDFLQPTPEVEHGKVEEQKPTLGGMIDAEARLNAIDMNRNTANVVSANFSAVGSSARYFQGTGAADRLAYNNLKVAELRKQTVQEGSTYVNGQIIKAPVDVVLRWGANPSDLDSHLTGPTGNPNNANERFHTYYAQPGSLDSAPNAMLYHDDTDSFGPEQTRINVVNPGVYRFYVYDFSNGNATGSTALSNSGATVTIHQSGSASLPEGQNLGAQVAQVNVPTGQTGNTWQAFELDSRTGVLNRTTEFRDVSNSQNVPFNQ